ncbi:LysR family transcriptional regulator [Hoeflea ulvae]|uniref:LysR family transcriptional regulator n=1 Tax=Hoeflea ulvae TaxID=2983764 RepID=A0ABT3YLU2_9HYPH|nr:LysR family transcriptional regulator [Hoeflea ulvae]MCY0096860.1 LysR family transcriptional regulator [Hoeflea ulvae]
MNSRKSIDLRLLSYFLQTAELGGVSKAAKALNLAQPTLSKAIQLLEYQLGAAVFERRPHGVELTVIGERLLRHARLVVAQVSDAVEEIDNLRTGGTGHIRVGAGPSWLRRLLPEAVAAALSERPALQVTVTGGFDERLLHGLSEGDLDLVIAEVPLNEKNNAYEVEVLSRDDLVVCARSGHPLHGVKNPGIERVLVEPWALPPPHTLARRKLDGKLISLGKPPPLSAATSSSVTFLLALVRGSDALTYTTASTLETNEGSGLVRLDVPELMTSREAGLIFRRPVLISPAAEFLVEKLRIIARDHPHN